MRWFLFAALFALAAAFGAGGAVAAEGINYVVSLKGVDDKAFRRAILEHAGLSKKKLRPFPTMRALRRHIETSQPRIDELLRSRGYYGASQSFAVTKNSDSDVEASITIRLGPVYKIAKYDVRVTTPGEPRDGVGFPISELGLALGDAALSDVIVNADARLLSAFGRRAYPLAKQGKRRVIVDHETRTMSVEIVIDIGPYTRFGSAKIDGLVSVDRALVERHIDWIEGTPFNTDRLEQTRKKLRQTGLFASVLVRPADNPQGIGALDVRISVKERKHRSIGAGGSYSTSEGALGKLLWEHRNLWGDGERLRVRGELGEIRQGLFSDLRINDFMTKNQNLVFDARISSEQPDGFESTEAVGGARLERQFSAVHAGSIGLGFDWSEVDENGEVETFTFLTTPLVLRRDTSDSLLDPGHGGRNTLTMTPNVGLGDTDVNFLSTRLFNTQYLSLLPEKKLIFAGWIRLGTIVGEETAAIPANKRLYAGGAGSVRGYGLNSIGPLDAQNDPVGGRSLTEIGVELRWRVAGPFGAVAFVEAGGVYDGSFPDWGQDLQWGAGLGARYLTKIGPLRLDVAVPLNRRNVVDDAFQLLVSLGQAF